MLRVIQETKPRWIIGENVPGIINLGLETTVVDLEAEGYEVELLVLPACGVGAWHQRYRAWIVGNARSKRPIGDNKKKSFGVGLEMEQDSLDEDRWHKGKYKHNPSDTHVANAHKQHDDNRRSRTGKASQFKETGLHNSEQWDSEPSVGRVANGISNTLDRLKGLGNAIVPQVAYEIMKGINVQEE